MLRRRRRRPPSLCRPRPRWKHALPFCQSDTAPCTYSNSGDGQILLGGGTGFASSAFAGVVALVNQKYGARQGQADYTLYRLATGEYGAPGAPNTSPTAPSLATCEGSNARIILDTGCLFYDIYRTAQPDGSYIVGSTDQPCGKGTPNCYAPAALPRGLLSARNGSFVPVYPLAKGYDLATGIGSINVANLVNAWTTASYLGTQAASAAASGVDETADRKAEAMALSVSSSAFASQYGMFAAGAGCAAINMSNGVYTDAFNSNVAPYSVQHNSTYGHIATEGNVTLSGGSTVGGTIYVPNTTVGTACQLSGGKVNQGISSTNGATCTPGRACSRQLLTTAVPAAPSVPAVTSSGKTTTVSTTTVLDPSKFANANSANSLTITGGASVTFPAGVYYIYDLAISNGATVTLGQGSYYLNSINLSGGSTFNLALTAGQKGPVALYITGTNQTTPVNLSNGTVANQTLVAANLAIFYAGTGGVALSGGTNAYFVVDAPNAAISLSNGAGIYGAIVGRTIVDTGGVALHFDQALSQLSQTITFPNPGTQTYGVAPVALTATASSGLPVTYSVVSGPATVSGNTLSITGAGSVTVEADQAGNSSYLPAPAVQQTFAVNRATLTATASNLAKTYGAANPALTYTMAGFINGDTQTSATSGAPSLTTTATSASPAGTYAIAAAQGTLAAANYTFSFVNGTLTIGKAALTVTAQNASMTYGGALPTFTASYSGCRAKPLPRVYAAGLRRVRDRAQSSQHADDYFASEPHPN